MANGTGGYASNQTSNSTYSSNKNSNVDNSNRASGNLHTACERSQPETYVQSSRPAQKVQNVVGDSFSQMTASILDEGVNEGLQLP